MPDWIPAIDGLSNPRIATCNHLRKVNIVSSTCNDVSNPTSISANANRRRHAKPPHLRSSQETTPHPPSCLDYEKPAYGVPGPIVRTQNSWTISHDDHDWTFGVGATDVAILKRWDDDEWYRKCTHLDACGGIAASDSSQGELTFELPTSHMTSGLVIVCGCCGKNVGETMFLKNTNLEIKWNGKVLNKSKMDVYPNDKCVRLVKAFKEFNENSDISKETEMLLSFHLTKKANEVKISHLIFL